MPKAVPIAKVRERPKLAVRFFRLIGGREPVREWLKGLADVDRKAIGDDIRTVQFGWPLGMPLVRKIASDLWEVRTHVRHGFARVLFTVDQAEAVLLHGFVKKSQRIPRDDMDTAVMRLKLVQRKE